MSETNSQNVVKFIISSLAERKTDRQISNDLNAAGYTTQRGFPFTPGIVMQEVYKLRYPQDGFSSALYKALILALATSQVSLQEISFALYTPRRKVVA